MPSAEDIKKGEDMLTPAQREMSDMREKGKGEELRRAAQEAGIKEENLGKIILHHGWDGGGEPFIQGTMDGHQVLANRDSLTIDGVEFSDEQRLAFWTKYASFAMAMEDYLRREKRLSNNVSKEQEAFEGYQKIMEL